MIKKLREISLFFNIEEDILKEISSFCYIKKYEKDKIIFFENETKPYFYAVLFGQVLMYDVDLKGDIIPFNEFSKGEVFGLISKLQNAPFCLNAKTQSHTILIEINYKEFQKYIEKQPFSNRIIKMLSNHILKQTTMQKLLKYDSTTRVIYTLLHFPEKLKKKKYLLAKELHMTPETFSRILSKLKQENLICYCENSIKILKEEELRKKLRI